MCVRCAVLKGLPGAEEAMEVPGDHSYAEGSPKRTHAQWEARNIPTGHFLVFSPLSVPLSYCICTTRKVLDVCLLLLESCLEMRGVGGGSFAAFPMPRVINWTETSQDFREAASKIHKRD